MKYDAKTLKINSFILVILAILDIVIMIGQIMASQLSVEKIMELADTTKNIAEFSMAAYIGVNSAILETTTNME